MLTGVSCCELSELPPSLGVVTLLAPIDQSEFWTELDISDAIPLDNAESKLLFSDEGVRTGLELSPLAVTFEEIWRLLGEFTENLFEVKMSMSAWVISSSTLR